MGTAELAVTLSDSGGGSELKQYTCARESFAAPRWGFSCRGASKRCCCVR